MALAYPNANTWEKFFLKNVEAEAFNKLITAIREKMLDTQTCLRVVRSGAGRSRILWSRVAMVGAARGFPSLPAPAGDAALFAMAVALVPVPQRFYGLRLLPYLWQFSGCETMRSYSP